MAGELTISVGAVMRPLPKFVQGLTDAQYKYWAEWQNRQAEAKRIRGRSNVPELPYDSVQRTTTTVMGEGTALGRRRGGSVRGGAFAAIATTDEGSVDFLNPRYVPTPGAVIFNPFARVKGGGGSPDWDSLFMPFEGEVMTVSEALDKFSGPVNPEALFAECMKEFFPK